MNWPGQKVGGAPVAQPAPQQQQAPRAPQGGPVLRTVAALPDPQQDYENSRNAGKDAQDAAKNTFRTMTPAEAQAQGLPAGGVYQINGLGQVNTIKAAPDVKPGEPSPGQAKVAAAQNVQRQLTELRTIYDRSFKGADAFEYLPSADKSRFQAIARSMRADLKPLIRGPGEGTFTEGDQALLDQLIPNPDEFDAYNEQIFDELDARINSTLQQFGGGQSAAPAGGVQVDPQAVSALDAAMRGGASFEEIMSLAQRLNVTVTPEQVQANIALRDAGKPFSNARAVAPPVAPDPRDEMGFFGSIKETLTGSARSTPEIEALPDWATMPELNSLSVDSFQAALGTMISDPQESLAIIQSQFPGVQARQDANGNIIMRSSLDGQEYAVKPGFRASDIPRAAGALLAFTPAGRATTVAGGFTGGALTQAGIETTQAATGGNFDASEVALAGVGGAAAPLVTRTVQAARGALPSRAAATPVAQAAPEIQPSLANADPNLSNLDRAAGSNLAQPLAPEQATEFGEIAKAALGRGKPAREAKDKLAIAAQANPEAKAAAERLGIELPVDIIADDARLLTTQGLARSQIGSGAQSEWGATVRATIDKSDATLAEIGASRDLAQLSDDVRSRLQGDMDALETAGDALRADVNAAIDVRAPVEATNLQSVLGQRIEDLGGIAEAKQAFSSEEKKLLAMLGEGDVPKRPTYARLEQVRDDIGRALFKKQGPWVDTNEAALKKYYGALAEDRVAHVQSIGGDDLANKLRASNDTFVKMYGVRSTMQTVFGKTLEKDIGTLVNRSIGNASKGDAKDLRTLLAAVPDDMKGQTLLSGLMSRAERSSAGGGFSFDNYAKLYRGIRQNGPIYNEIAKTVGPQATQILQDLYVISSRMAAAEAKIVRTGASNQPILNALRSESLVARTVEAGKRVGARGVGAIAGGATGGPVGAAVGQEISGAMVDAISRGGKRNLDQLHDLISSEPFRDLVIKAGTGNGDIRAANRLAADPRFVRFGKALGLNSLDARKRWITDAMRAAPASAASLNDNALTVQSGAFSSAAQPQSGDSNTTGSGTR